MSNLPLVSEKNDFPNLLEKHSQSSLPRQLTIPSGETNALLADQVPFSVLEETINKLLAHGRGNSSFPPSDGVSSSGGKPKFVSLTHV